MFLVIATTKCQSAIKGPCASGSQKISTTKKKLSTKIVSLLPSKKIATGYTTASSSKIISSGLAIVKIHNLDGDINWPFVTVKTSYTRKVFVKRCTGYCNAFYNQLIFEKIVFRTKFKVYLK